MFDCELRLHPRLWWLKRFGQEKYPCTMWQAIDRVLYLDYIFDQALGVECVHLDIECYRDKYENSDAHPACIYHP